MERAATCKRHSPSPSVARRTSSHASSTRHGGSVRATSANICQLRRAARSLGHARRDRSRRGSIRRMARFHGACDRSVPSAPLARGRRTSKGFALGRHPLAIDALGLATTGAAGPTPERREPLGAAQADRFSTPAAVFYARWRVSCSAGGECQSSLAVGWLPTSLGQGRVQTGDASAVASTRDALPGAFAGAVPWPASCYSAGDGRETHSWSRTAPGLDPAAFKHASEFHSSLRGTEEPDELHAVGPARPGERDDHLLGELTLQDLVGQLRLPHELLTATSSVTHRHPRHQHWSFGTHSMWLLASSAIASKESGLSESIPESALRTVRNPSLVRHDEPANGLWQTLWLSGSFPMVGAAELTNGVLWPGAVQSPRPRSQVAPPVVTAAATVGPSALPAKPRAVATLKRGPKRCADRMEQWASEGTSSGPLAPTTVVRNAGQHGHRACLHPFVGGGLRPRRANWRGPLIRQLVRRSRLPGPRHSGTHRIASGPQLLGWRLPAGYRQQAGLGRRPRAIFELEALDGRSEFLGLLCELGCGRRRLPPSSSHFAGSPRSSGRWPS